jgi:hypothetical protein
MKNQHLGTGKSAFIRYLTKDALGQNKGTLQSFIYIAELHFSQ